MALLAIQLFQTTLIEVHQNVQIQSMSNQILLVNPVMMNCALTMVEKHVLDKNGNMISDDGNINERYLIKGRKQTIKMAT